MVSETDENLEVDLELAEEENLNELSDETEETIESVSYTHLTLPTTPYV